MGNRKPRRARNHRNPILPMVAATLTVTLCIGCLTSGTYAWFTDNVTSSASSITSASFAVDVECVNFVPAESTLQQALLPARSAINLTASALNGSALSGETQKGTYTFQLTATGNATLGYCQVTAQQNGKTETWNTCNFGQGETVTLEVSIPADCTLTFTPVWADVKATASTAALRASQTIRFFGAKASTSYAESLGLDTDTIFGMPEDGIVSQSCTITTLMPSDAQLSGLRQTAMLEVLGGYQFYGWAIQSEFGYTVAVPDASLEETLRGVYDGTDGEPFTLTLRAIYTKAPKQETAEPEETIPETTTPEETVPETTVPETTVPETTVPETTAPEETVPETTESVITETEQTQETQAETQKTHSETQETQETQAETEEEISLFALTARIPSSASAIPTTAPTVAETQPTVTQLAETQPIETHPQETRSEETQPTETQPTETQPTETQPAETQPTETQPTETQPQETQPEETQPTVPVFVSKVADAASIPLSADEVRQRVMVLLSPAPEETEAEESEGPTGTCGVPLYFQNDYPYNMYGEGTIATSGCGITCLAMVANYMTGHEYLPDELAGYFGSRAGNNMARLVAGSETLQLPFEQAENWDFAYQALKDGKLVILMVDYLSKFTDTQHFLVLTGLTEDGKILVNDPNRDNYDKWDLKDGFVNGFTAGELLQGWSGAWIYDPSAMPEEPFIYYEEPVQRPEMRYPDILLTQDEIELLAKVVWVEAQGECAEGQQAVAEVALNRIASGNFPNNLHDVIYGEGQFRSVPKLDEATPWQAQYEAIENAIYGPYVLPEDVVYFATTPTNDNVWGQIGGHIFCYGN